MYYITNHAQERYLERVRNGLCTSNNLLSEMLPLVYNSVDITTKVFDDNPRYILYLYEKYKSAKCKILINDKLIFICRKREGTANLYDVFTCYYGMDVINGFKRTRHSRSEIFFKIAQIKKKIKNEI